MKGRVLFINPPIAREDLYGKYAGGGSFLPPLGIAYLAAVTRRAGYETHVIDAPALGHLTSDVVNQTKDLAPDYIGISATTVSIHSAGYFAESLRKEGVTVPIWNGGAHVTAAPAATMETFPAFDVGVLREGELTVLDLLRAWEENRPLKEIKGIIYRDGGRPVITEPREYIQDLDTLPFPAWDLLPYLPRYYRPSAHSVKRLPSTSLITSRGCFGRCTFCDNAVFGRKIRMHSVDRVIAMIEALKENWGVRDIQFDDDVFLANRKRVMEFCEKLRDRRLNISWCCKARVDIITPEILREMKRAGCWQIQYGIESGDEGILSSINKNISLQKIRQSLGETRRAGMETKAFYIMGHLDETHATARRTIDSLLSLPLDDFQMTLMTPYPGSADYERAPQCGYFEKDWRQMNEYAPVFVPSGMSKEDLLRYQAEAFRRFYLRPRQVLKYASRLRRPSAWGSLIGALWAFVKGALFVRKGKS